MMIALDWAEIAKIATVALTSATKFLLSPAAAYYFEFGLTKSLIVTTTGGLAGILAFSFLGRMLRIYWRYFIMLFVFPFSRFSYMELVNRPPKKFSVTQRLIVRVRNKFGLAGIAFITPCIISIPVGSIIAMNFYKKKGVVLLALTISLLVWSLILNLVTPPVIEYFSDITKTI